MNTSQGRAAAPDGLFADADLRALRMKVCNACPELQRMKLGATRQVLLCGKCHCPLFHKTRLRAAACPLGKW